VALIRFSRGPIAAGKLPHIVLVEGDPVKDIRDLRTIFIVIKAGNVYEFGSSE
jgi:imidazolonepropionase-like amidohydrolase